MISPNRNFHGKENNLLEDDDFDFEDEEEVEENNSNEKEQPKETEESSSPEDDNSNTFEDEDEDDDDSDINVTNLEKELFRSKMMKLFLIVFVGLIIILLISFVASFFSSKNYNYSEIEEIMEEAAKSYFIDHKDKLPKTNEQIVEISDKILVNNDYMKPLDKYTKESCTGKVDVEKISSSEYNYTAYLTCSGYSTKELAKAVKDQGIVTEGYGLYNVNNEYIYRGKDVDNYVKFVDSDVVWRVVKVTSNNEVALLQDSSTVNGFIWDDRYNTQSEDNTGINSFRNSYVVNVLNSLYNNKLSKIEEYDNEFDDEEAILTKHDRSRLVSFDACVGKRSTTDISRDGSSECSEKFTTKASLITVYDYMNASLDKNCTTALSLSCQNYNYLSKGDTTWTSTPVADESDKVYYLSTYINTREASDDLKLRLLVHAGSNTMVDSGNGSKEKPFIIR